MLVAMAVVGSVIADAVSKVTIENSAAATALFVESLLGPLTQSLATSDGLPPGKSADIDQLLAREQFKHRFPYLEIWKEGGLVVYSTTADLVGRNFTPPPGLIEALAGDVAAQYTDLSAEEHEIRDFSTKYLEIYVPLREHLSGRIIAVAEIHEVTAPLEQKLWDLRLKTCLAIAGASILIMGSLFGIVYRANRMIVAQQDQLHQRMAELEQTSRQNWLLRERVARASGRVAEVTENYLRRIGAELHDGPAQLIGLANLKVEHVRRARTKVKREKELQALDGVLTDALHDVRTLSKGLMLPEIEKLPLPAIVERAVIIHEQRTGSKVTVQCDDDAPVLSHAVKICVFRFIQEGLNNAFRHAGGSGQRVICSVESATLTLTVEDNGNAGDSGTVAPGSGLGLIGLRERVESLGGVFEVGRRAEGGTRIEMRVNIAEGDRDERADTCCRRG